MEASRVLLLLSVFLAFRNANAGPLVAFDDFEHDDGSATVVWSAQKTRSTASAYSGGYSLLIYDRDSSQPEAGVRFKYSIVPGVKYNAELYVRLEAGPASFFKLKAFSLDSNNQKIGNPTEGTAVSVDTNFVKLSVDFQTASNGVYARIAINNAGGANYSVDYVSFHKKLCSVGGTQDCEFIKMVDFESSTNAGWGLNGAGTGTTGTLDTDSHTGSRSLKVTNRVKDWHGMKVTLTNIPADTIVYLEAYLKILSQPKFMGQNVVFKAKLGNGVIASVARDKFFRLNSGFTKFSGDFVTPATGGNVEIRLSVENNTVDYLVDSVRIYKVVPDSDWEQTANSAIENIRMDPISFSIDFTGGTAADYSLKVQQTRHHFRFGMAVREPYLVPSDPLQTAVRNWVFNDLDVDSVSLQNGYKWPQLQKYPWPPTSEYNDIKTALQTIVDRGLWVHIHNLLWSKYGNNPAYVESADASTLRDLIDGRIEYTLSNFTGMVNSLVIGNEVLANQYFEEKLQDYRVIPDAFLNVSNIEPSIVACTNEFKIMRDPADSTQAYINMVNAYTASDGFPECVCAQCHIKEQPNNHQHIRRFEALIEGVGSLPIHFSEVSAEVSDGTVAGQMYKDITRLCFSKPSCVAITYWNLHRKDYSGGPADASLLDTVNGTITATTAGQAVKDLKDGWTTSFNEPLQSGNFFSLNGNTFTGSKDSYHGKYKLSITDSAGQSIHDFNFDHDPGQSKSVACSVDLAQSAISCN